MPDTSVLARKWRPKTFVELGGQEHVVRALSNALSQNRLHHAYLFTGTRGVGKTTIARIFAKSLNCSSGVTATPCGECSACKEIDAGRFVDLIELDAASNTQVDNMRELLESALYAPTSGRFKVYIIDEVHMLSKSAFNAMLKTLEEPPGYVKFILATTDPQRIPVTVLSRCLQFNLKQLPPSLIGARLQYVLEQELLTFESAAVNLVARAAQGSMRDALSLMDQAIAFSDGDVKEAVVRAMLGAIDQNYLFDLLTALHEQDGVKMIRIADDMAARSVAFDAALQDMATLLHRIALAQTVPQAVLDEEPERGRLLELGRAFRPEETQLFYQIAIHGRDEIDLAPDEYAGFTMTLLRMLSFAPARDSSPQPDIVTPEVVRPEASTGRVDWGVLLAQLDVHGMALQLAKNSTLESFKDGRITLCLSQEHKHLQGNRNAIENLQSTLSDYFVMPVRLDIVVGKAEFSTPAEVEQQTKKIKEQQAADAISQDRFVGDALAELDADVVTDSVKPIR